MKATVPWQKLEPSCGNILPRSTVCIHCQRSLLLAKAVQQQLRIIDMLCVQGFLRRVAA